MAGGDLRDGLNLELLGDINAQNLVMMNLLRLHFSLIMNRKNR